MTCPARLCSPPRERPDPGVPPLEVLWAWSLANRPPGQDLVGAESSQGHQRLRRSIQRYPLNTSKKSSLMLQELLTTFMETLNQHIFSLPHPARGAVLSRQAVPQVGWVTSVEEGGQQVPCRTQGGDRG